MPIRGSHVRRRHSVASEVILMNAESASTTIVVPCNRSIQQSEVLYVSLQRRGGLPTTCLHDLHLAVSGSRKILGVKGGGKVDHVGSSAG